MLRPQPAKVRNGSTIKVVLNVTGPSLPEKEKSVDKPIRIAIAVEADQSRWAAYGASDTPEDEAQATVRDIVDGCSATLWVELQIPEQLPATVPARISLPSRESDG